MFKTIEDAYRANLIQLTLWLPENKENLDFVNKFFNNIIRDPDRKVMMVKKENKIAVFANNIAFFK